MPPKEIVKYPRYFKSEDPRFRDCVIVFPSEGSLGSAYYHETRYWGKPQWKLSEMAQPPADIEITERCANYLQRVADRIPKELPPFKAESPEQ